MLLMVLRRPHGRQFDRGKADRPPERVDRAAAGPLPPPPSPDHLRVAHASYDGPKVAARMAQLSGLPLERAAIFRACPGWTRSSRVDV